MHPTYFASLCIGNHRLLTQMCLRDGGRNPVLLDFSLDKCLATPGSCDETGENFGMLLTVSLVASTSPGNLRS